MTTKAGLEGIVAADTVLSEVDGEGGHLIVRGHTLDELVGRWSFEEVITLLLGDFFEELSGLDLRRSLGAARVAAFAVVPRCLPVLSDLSPFDAMRALIASLSDGDDLRTALRLIAAPAVFTAAAIRVSAGQQPVRPDSSLAHAADFLRMLRGGVAQDSDAAALDRYLVTVADHGLNASTFAARVVASTHAGLGSAVIAALSALKGPLHGGAPGPVLDMLDEIGTAENAQAWLEGALASGERLMGFGHRIYRVRDPRANALRETLKELMRARELGNERLALAEAVEQTALALLRREKPGRSLDTNVEFYTALLLEALAIPRTAFTCVFAVGRVGGWIAHAREQVLNGRLLRPVSRYVGPDPAVSMRSFHQPPPNATSNPAVS